MQQRCSLDAQLEYRAEKARHYAARTIGAAQFQARAKAKETLDRHITRQELAASAEDKAAGHGKRRTVDSLSSASHESSSEALTEAERLLEDQLDADLEDELRQLGILPGARAPCHAVRHAGADDWGPVCMALGRAASPAMMRDGCGRWQG